MNSIGSGNNTGKALWDMLWGKRYIKINYYYYDDDSRRGGVKVTKCSSPTTTRGSHNAQQGGNLDMYKKMPC